MPRRTSDYDTRFRETLKRYMKELVDDERREGGTQNKLAERAGVPQSSLSAQADGTRHVTLELLDKVAIARRRSVVQVLTRIRDIAQELPGAHDIPRPRVVSPADQFADEKALSESLLTEEPDGLDESQPSGPSKPKRPPKGASSGKRGR